MRSWFALEKSEFMVFAWDVGTKDWLGFDLSHYPPRAFGSIAERDRVSELLDTWRSEGYSNSVDRGFSDIAHDRFSQHPVRSFLFVPFLRMAHFWINIEGAQSYLRVLLMQRPFSTIIVAFTLLQKLLLIFVAVLGAYAIWFWPRIRTADQVPLARFASIFVVLRTVELGVLGAFVLSGLMESRYVLVSFPFVILLSFWGLRFFWEEWAERQVKREGAAQW
jgi:hypothetical protein